MQSARGSSCKIILFEKILPLLPDPKPKTKPRPSYATEKDPNFNKLKKLSEEIYKEYKVTKKCPLTLTKSAAESILSLGRSLLNLCIQSKPDLSSLERKTIPDQGDISLPLVCGYSSYWKKWFFDFLAFKRNDLFYYAPSPSGRFVDREVDQYDKKNKFLRQFYLGINY